MTPFVIPGPKPPRVSYARLDPEYVSEAIRLKLWADGLLLDGDMQFSVREGSLVVLAPVQDAPAARAPLPIPNPSPAR